MKASIVIVNYNYARFLPQAIESALRQDHRDTEVIVIDDGSTDDSANVIHSYRSLISSLSRKHIGQLGCYTVGLGVATGDVVLYLDADDFLYPDCLSKVLAKWRPGCVKAHFYLEVVNEHGNRLDAVVPSGRLGSGGGPLTMMRLFGAYCSPPASGNVYRRDFLGRVLPSEYDERFRQFDQIQFGGDSVPILTAPFFGDIVDIPKVLGCYRRHAGASGGVTSTFRLESSLQMLEKEHQKELARDSAWRLALRRSEPVPLLEPSRVKRRFCYLRLSGDGLDSADSRLNLLLKGMISAICWDGYSFLQKFAIIGWFLAMAIAPFELAKKLIRPALGISDRPAGMRQLLSLNFSQMRGCNRSPTLGICEKFRLRHQNGPATPDHSDT
jgi:Glycosyl transferase family 2